MQAPFLLGNGAFLLRAGKRKSGEEADDFILEDFDFLRILKKSLIEFQFKTRVAGLREFPPKDFGKSIRLTEIGIIPSHTPGEILCFELIHDDISPLRFGASSGIIEQTEFRIPYLTV